MLAATLLIDDFADKAARAVDLVGPNIVALAAGANHAYATKWAEGTSRPATSLIRRVCLVSTISDYIADSLEARGLEIGDGPVADIQAFFTGASAAFAKQTPPFESRSAIEVIRTVRFRKAAELVSSAALSYVE